MICDLFFHYFCKNFRQDYIDRMDKINKIIFIIFLLIPFLGISQVDIKISIDNQNDSVFYFCKYRGAKNVVIDTLKLENGIIHYKNKTKLPEGIYLLTNDKNYQMIEVLVGKKQKFSMSINDLEDLNSAKAKNAKETDIYYRLMAKVRETDANIKALKSEKEFYPENQKKIDSLRKDLEKFEESLKIKRKDAFINLVINSIKYRLIENYWDDFPLDDARILTFPMIDNKLETYFNNLPVDAETINSEIDKLIVKTGDCTEVRDYLLWFFYVKYFNPNYMNLDDVYIHLVREYFLKLDMKNVSKSVVNMMEERANYLENLKLGAKIPEIGNLYSIESQYVAVVFYDRSCQKCAKEGRILEEIRTRHPEMTIYPVEISSTNIKNLMSLYDIQTTPMIYLLDNQKNIIAKRLKAEQVEQFIKNE